MDAPGHHCFDQRTHVFLGHRALVFMITRTAAPISDRLILQIALAALIADRAIERVVDEEKLHHPLARFLHHRAIGANVLPLSSRQRARRLRLRRPRLHFNQTHPAIARNAQPLMIAKTRNFLPRQLASLQHRRACGNFELYAIDFEFRHC